MQTLPVERRLAFRRGHRDEPLRANDFLEERRRGGHSAAPGRVRPSSPWRRHDQRSPFEQEQRERARIERGAHQFGWRPRAPGPDRASPAPAPPGTCRSPCAAGRQTASRGVPSRCVTFGVRPATAAPRAAPHSGALVGFVVLLPVTHAQFAEERLRRPSRTAGVSRICSAYSCTLWSNACAGMLPARSATDARAGGQQRLASCRTAPP